MQSIVEFHREALDLFPDQETITSFLEKQAETLFRAHQNRDARMCLQVNNWFPTLICAKDEDILNGPFSLDDAKLTIAKEYGFSNWQAVVDVKPQAFHLDFEYAVNAIVEGNIDRLKELLNANPGLIHARTQFGHGSSLLHYVAANGVETWRQRVPANAVEITQLLVDRGADVGAHANMYGGGQTTMALLVTSAHPEEAGLTESIGAVLRGAGG